jgi:hypothetical protein
LLMDCLRINRLRSFLDKGDIEEEFELTDAFGEGRICWFVRPRCAGFKVR